MFKRLAVVTILGLVALSAAGKPILAQNSVNSPVTFTVSPALVDTKLQPGQTITVDITLTNHTDLPQPFRAYVKDFTAKGLDGEVTFGDAEESTSYAASKWVLLDQPSILLDPKGSQTVKATIKAPLNAEPGGHYASVLFEQMIQSLPSESMQVTVAARLATLLFLTVDGDVVEAGQVLGATPGSNCSAVVCGFKVPTFIDKGPVPFSFIFNNTGNVHVRPKGSITIEKGGKTVATLPIEDRAVLPNSQRLFETEWSEVVLAGKYTAKLHLVYGTNNYTIDMQTTFWAFPWQIVLAVVVVVLAAVGVFLWRKYRSVALLRHRLTRK